MKPNILWLTLDSVRADHTSMSHYHRETTPRMKELGTTGQTFDLCFSAGTVTAVSSASILTGTYPFHHGLKITNDYLPETLDTVPQILSRLGYTTACLSRNSYLSSGTGLDRGFDTFEWLAASTLLDAVPATVLGKYLLNIRRHSAGLTTDTAKHATPYLMNEVAKRWLGDLQSTTPFFFYLHYNEPHRPYFPPLPYLDEYSDSFEMSTEDAAEFSMEVHENAHELIANGLDFTDDEWAALRAMYDAEIAYTDEMVGQLLDYVHSLDIGETIIVISADHGELLGEHGLLSHTIAVDDALSHVPLVTQGLDDIAHQTDELVQHVDIIQTILAKLGADTEQLQGIDLRSDIREQAYTQRAEQEFDTFYGYNPDFDASDFHHDKVTSARTKDFRYQKSSDLTKLFKLPDEETDVSDQHGDVVARLDSVLEEWLEQSGRPVSASNESELTSSMQKQLRDLGYLE